MSTIVSLRLFFLFALFGLAATSLCLGVNGLKAWEQADSLHSQLSKHNDAPAAAAASSSVPVCLQKRGGNFESKARRKFEADLHQELSTLHKQLAIAPENPDLQRKAQCVRDALDTQHRALESVTKYLVKAKRIEKKAIKQETALLNLPCDLDEGPHVEKCEDLECEVAGYRKRVKNQKKQAATLYLIHSLRHRRQFYEKQTDEESKQEAVKIKAKINYAKNKLRKLSEKHIGLECEEKPPSKLPPSCEKLSRRNDDGHHHHHKIEPPKPPPKPKRHKWKHPFHFRTACASGDPHVDTWDGLHHDTMISGWFTWVQNEVITVQAYSQLGCMPHWIPNTCIRAVVVRIKVPETEETLFASWGNWPPQGHMQNVMVQDSFGANVNQHPHHFRGGVYLNGKYNVRWAHGQLRITPHGNWIRDADLAVSVTIGTYLLVVTLPNAPPHRGGSNGLFGWFHGDGNRHYPANFRLRNGQHSGVTQRALCQRCGWGGMQTNQVMDWAATHVVTGPHGSNPPIGFGQGHLRQTRYLNSYHRHRVHHGLLQVNETSNPMDLLLEVAADFSPFPQESKAVILPSFVPKVTNKKLAFCRAITKKAFAAKKAAGNKKDLKKKKPWWKGKVCLSDEQLAKLKKEIEAHRRKRAIEKGKFKAALNSCLQDADNPKVAKTVGAATKVAAKMAAKAKKSLNKVVKKEAAKDAAKKSCKKNAAGPTPPPIPAPGANGGFGGPGGAGGGGGGAGAGGFGNGQGNGIDGQHGGAFGSNGGGSRGSAGGAGSRNGAGGSGGAGSRNGAGGQSSGSGAGGKSGAGSGSGSGSGGAGGVNGSGGAGGADGSNGSSSRRGGSGQGWGQQSINLDQPDYETRPAKFENGFWVGAFDGRHTNKDGQLCHDCGEKIIYNKDSPISDDDKKLLVKQYIELPLSDVKLHSQRTLDRAVLQVDDANYLKKKLLDKYPVQED